MTAGKIQVIRSHRSDPYQDKVVRTYDDPPELWEKALGSEGFGFQFGLFDATELTAGASPGPIGPSEIRHFDRQLELAGLSQSAADRQPQFKRILDLGCGWGSITEHLARTFPDCPRIDAINISQRQLDYFADTIPAELAARIHLYLCNGQDIDLLPDPEVPYDLVVVRGVYTHFLPEVFEQSVAQVVQRLAPGGILLISDQLYKTNNLATYESHIPDKVDRLACGNRKTIDYYLRVLLRNGLILQDFRQLPSAAQVAHWFQVVRLNIEQNFPHGATGPIQELHQLACNGTKTVAQNKVGMFSIIALRAPA
jgi:cyclopropane fatty-acyl-phospholipid synthase-like methyltransferase